MGRDLVFVDITDEDMPFFAKDDVTPQEIQEHLSFITADAKRQTEVKTFSA